MKILVISDTHLSLENLRTVLEREQQLDLVLHLGDAQGEYEKIRKMCGCPLEMVRGNCDHLAGWLPEEKIISLGQVQALLAHGHHYGVSMTREKLAREAKKKGCCLAFYGHTHVPGVERYGNVLLLNPGSLTFPRQQPRRASYIILRVDGGTKICHEIKYL